MTVRDSELVDLVVRALRKVQHIEGDGAVAAAAEKMICANATILAHQCGPDFMLAALTAAGAAARQATETDQLGTRAAADPASLSAISAIRSVGSPTPCHAKSPPGTFLALRRDAHDAVKAHWSPITDNLARRDKPAAGFIEPILDQERLRQHLLSINQKDDYPWLNHNRCHALRTMINVSSPSTNAVSDITARLAFNCSSASSAKARTGTRS